MREMLDAIVIGSGPNGLAAAITLARAGRSVHVYEAHDRPGGGCRTAELTLPGFRHDVCSAIHPLGVAAPFMRSIPLGQHGVEWIHPPAPYAHPFDDGAVVIERSLDALDPELGPDASAWRSLFGPLAGSAEYYLDELLRPVRLIPGNPIAMARFGLDALRSVRNLVGRFSGERARGAFAGVAAHSTLRMEAPLSASFGLVLGLVAHHVGWPFPRGGAQSLTDALVSYAKSLRVEFHLGRRVTALAELPRARAYFFDTDPAQMGAIAADRLPGSYRASLSAFRRAPAAFKIDWALSGPIPWKSREVARAATVHLGPTYEEIATSEDAVNSGKVPEKPYCLVAQHTLFDPSRAPAGQHTGWAYCHVPNGCDVDMTDAIERQMERFAPGFRDLVLARHTFSPREFESYNPNNAGGDFSGGACDPWQLFFRPTFRLRPYSTPAPDVFICSASSPPGGGVHGHAGMHAAELALKLIL